MPDDKDKQGNTGCLVLLLLFPLVDFLGMCVATIGPSEYGLIAFTLALLGCGCGAALGLYLSKKTMPQTYGRRNFWLIGAFAGMAIPILVFNAILASQK
jgi:hypothetical protein